MGRRLIFANSKGTSRQRIVSGRKGLRHRGKRPTESVEAWALTTYGPLPPWSKADARRCRLFDDLVRSQEQLPRYGDSERVGGFQIDHHLEPTWLLDRQIRGFGTFENAIYITCSSAE